MTHRYAYTPQLLPWITVDIMTNERLLPGVRAVVDSGTSVNLLPHHVGLSLGLEWGSPIFPNIGKVRGRDCVGVKLGLGVKEFGAYVMRFAWSPDNDIPVLLGQVDFFQHFGIYFEASEQYFTLHPTAGEDATETS